MYNNSSTTDVHKVARARVWVRGLTGARFARKAVDRSPRVR